MKKMLVTLLAVVSIAIASVGSETSHYSDASTMSSLMSGDFRSSTYVVSITHQAGAGYNYLVLFDGSYNDGNATSKFISAVLACALVSETTSWSSSYLLVGFREGGAFKISTSNARYAFNNMDTMGAQWTLEYIESNSTFRDY